MESQPAIRSNSLTLWDIEKGIAELFDALDEAETPEGRAGCETALAEYFAREVQKVDGIRALYKHFDLLAEAARQEMRDLRQRALMFERRRDKIKEMCQIVMEANGLTRLEGRTGRLLLKGNGGLQPLEVTDEAQVPEECCKYVGWIGGKTWEWIREEMESDGVDLYADDFKLDRVIDNELTRQAIADQGGVPGARLGERGKHVEVK